MKLYFTETSPFVRKVRVAAIELGLADRIQLEFLRPSPTVANPTLSATNPLSKIPALVLDDGSTLYDSAVICEYLDTLSPTKKLTPASGAARFRVLRLQALCDGILEAGVLVFYERSGRPAEKHWEEWLSGQTQKATQGLDALEREVASFGDEIDLAQICAAITIGWLEFRKPVGDFRSGRPQLTAWYEKFSARPSMQATAPKA
jgi:glutathione S-transferase